MAGLTDACSLSGAPELPKVRCIAAVAPHEADGVAEVDDVEVGEVLDAVVGGPPIADSSTLKPPRSL